MCGALNCGVWALLEVNNKLSSYGPSNLPAGSIMSNGQHQKDEEMKCHYILSVSEVWRRDG